MKLCLRCIQYFDDSNSACPKDSCPLESVGREPLIGALIGGCYLIESIISKGSSGIVYKGTQIQRREVVAVKVLHSYLGAYHTAIDRFLREARAANKLRNPHIVPIWDSGVTNDGQPFFVMDYLEGVTLSRLVREKGYIHLRRALSIVRQIAEALSEAHRHGIIHRDLKPDNIILQETDSAEDYVKLLDFGIADCPSESPSVEKPKTTAGSPAYMSPEQCQGFELDARSDIYSLGIVVFEMLTGKRPFSGEEHVSLMFLHVSQPPLKLRAIAPEQKYTLALEVLIEKALSKNPANRQSSVKDFYREMEAAVRASLPADSSGQFPAMPSTVVDHFSVDSTERLTSEYAHSLIPGSGSANIKTMQPGVPTTQEPLNAKLPEAIKGNQPKEAKQEVSKPVLKGKTQLGHSISSPFKSMALATQTLVGFGLPGAKKNTQNKQSIGDTLEKPSEINAGSEGGKAPNLTDLLAELDEHLVQESPPNTNEPVSPSPLPSKEVSTPRETEPQNRFISTKHDLLAPARVENVVREPRKGIVLPELSMATPPKFENRLSSLDLLGGVSEGPAPALAKESPSGMIGSTETNKAEQTGDLPVINMSQMPNAQTPLTVTSRADGGSKECTDSSAGDLVRQPAKLDTIAETTSPTLPLSASPTQTKSPEEGPTNFAPDSNDVAADNRSATSWHNRTQEVVMDSLRALAVQYKPSKDKTKKESPGLGAANNSTVLSPAPSSASSMAKPDSKKTSRLNALDLETLKRSALTQDVGKDIVSTPVPQDLPSNQSRLDDKEPSSLNADGRSFHFEPNSELFLSDKKPNDAKLQINESILANTSSPLDLVPTPQFNSLADTRTRPDLSILPPDQIEDPILSEREVTLAPQFNSLADIRTSPDLQTLPIEQSVGADKAALNGTEFRNLEQAPKSSEPAEPAAPVEPANIGVSADQIDLPNGPDLKPFTKAEQPGWTKWSNLIQAGDNTGQAPQSLSQAKNPSGEEVKHPAGDPSKGPIISETPSTFRRLVEAAQKKSSPSPGRLPDRPSTGSPVNGLPENDNLSSKKLELGTGGAKEHLSSSHAPEGLEGKNLQPSSLKTSDLGSTSKPKSDDAVPTGYNSANGLGTFHHDAAAVLESAQASCKAMVSTNAPGTRPSQSSERADDDLGGKGKDGGRISIVLPPPDSLKVEPFKAGGNSLAALAGQNFDSMDELAQLNLVQQRYEASPQRGENKSTSTRAEEVTDTRNRTQSLRARPGGVNVAHAFLIASITISLAYLCIKIILVIHSAPPSSRVSTIASIKPIKVLLEKNEFDKVRRILEKKQEAYPLSKQDIEDLDTAYINLAKEAIKDKKYENALTMVQNIGPKSVHFNEAKGLVKELKKVYKSQPKK